MKEETRKSKIETQKNLQDAAMAIVDGTFNIKEYYGITDNGLEAIYSVGLEMYKHKQYEKAKGVFAILSMLEPTSTKYVSACGSACFMLEDFLSAIHFFRLNLMKGDYTPKTFLRLAECTLKLDQLDLTKQYLEELIKLAKNDEFKDNKESKQWESRAGMMLMMVNEKLKQLAAADSTN